MKIIWDKLSIMIYVIIVSSTSCISRLYSDGSTEYLMEYMTACCSPVWTYRFLLQVDGRRLPAHKNILSVASEYFKAMFSHNMLENSMLEVPLVGLSYGALEQVLTYIYTGRLQGIWNLLIMSFKIAPPLRK